MKFCVDSPSYAPNQCNELVEIPSTDKAYEGAHHNHAKSKNVLEPFDSGIAFTAACKQAGLHDSYSREKLKWPRE